MIYFSLIVAVIGALIYLQARPESVKLAEMGRIAFFAGLLVFLMHGDEFVRLFDRFGRR